MLYVIIGRHTWNCQTLTHIHTKIHAHTHPQKKKQKEGGEGGSLITIFKFINIHIHHFKTTFMCPGSIAGVPFDCGSAVRFAPGTFWSFYYCAPIVCVLNFLGRVSGAAVSQIIKQTNPRKKES